MAELSGFGRKFTAKDYRFGILLTLHLSVFTALCVFIIWNYCHLAGEGPCQLEEIDDDGEGKGISFHRKTLRSRCRRRRKLEPSSSS